MVSIDVSKLPQKAPEVDLEQLLEAGCHFGHQSKRWHPKMADFIYMEKNGVHIFDLAKTAAQMQAAYNYAFELGKTGKTLVVVGTKRQAKDIVQEAATRVGIHYITSRWLGGFLTNWNQVKKSLKKMLDIEEGLKVGKYDKYTKYERMQLEKEAGRLSRFFGGLRNLKKAPDVLFVVDANREKVAVTEAATMGTPIIGMTDSNADPRQITVPIPTNDDAIKAIKLVVNYVLDGYEAGKKSK